MDFSIVIPAKNEQEHLPNCLDSLARLEFPPERYEVLVIDNGSTDKTVEIAGQYQTRVFVCPELTIAGLRNFGANHANGQILAFLDADCTVATDWLTAASRWRDQEDVCCFGSPPEVAGNGTWVQKAWFIVRSKRHIVEEVEWLESMNMFVRKKIFDLVTGFDATLTTCEDYDLSLRLQGHGRIVADKRIRAVHHGEATTLNHFFRKECWRGVSNFSGLARHGLHLLELPSLFAPIMYVLCLAVTVFAFMAMTADGEIRSLKYFVSCLLCWQLPIFLLAVWKGRFCASPQLRFGLYLLLNVYFFARGTSMLRGWRK